MLVVAGLSACNDSTTATDDPAAPTTSAASESPSESASEEPPAGETVDTAEFLDTVLSGIEDATTAHVSMTMQGGPAQMTMEGDVDYAATPPEMSMSMTNSMLGEGGMEMRMVDGAMYMQMPQLGKGKWFKVPLGGPDSLLPGDLLDQMDPGQAIEGMQDAVDDVTYVGEEDVDGETLRHYTMTVRSEAFRDLQKQFGGTGAADLPSAITYDIWLDGDDRMRKTEIAMGDLGSVTMTMSGWGEPVDIEAPPAADVVRMPGGMQMS